jgi:hypothetical protein
MSVNTLTFEQISTVLNSIVKQATGQASITATTTGDFVSVAQTALSAGNDAVMNAVSNVMSRTIFSIRPYSAKFVGLEKSEPVWGAYMRKLSISNDDWADDEAYDYPVLHHIINHYQEYVSLSASDIAMRIYKKSQEVISMEFSTIADKNKFIPQLDLYKM